MPKLMPNQAIEELNDRFREHGIGYQFEDGETVRVDSQYIHTEVVKSAISLLNTPGSGALRTSFSRPTSTTERADTGRP